MFPELLLLQGHSKHTKSTSEITGDLDSGFEDNVRAQLMIYRASEALRFFEGSCTNVVRSESLTCISRKMFARRCFTRLRSPNKDHLRANIGVTSI